MILVETLVSYIKGSSTVIYAADLVISMFMTQYWHGGMLLILVLNYNGYSFARIQDSWWEAVFW